MEFDEAVSFFQKTKKYFEFGARCERFIHTKFASRLRLFVMAIVLESMIIAIVPASLSIRTISFLSIPLSVLRYAFRLLIAVYSIHLFNFF